MNSKQGEAVGWALMSASSFPIGCVVGLLWRRCPLLVRGLSLGFGAGGLLMILTVSLYGRRLFHMDEYGHGPVVVLFSCVLVGGILFILVDSLIELRGGWFRRLSIQRQWLKEWRKKRLRPIIDKFRKKKNSDRGLANAVSLRKEIEKELNHDLTKFKRATMQLSKRQSKRYSMFNIDSLSSPFLDDGHDEDDDDGEANPELEGSEVEEGEEEGFSAFLWDKALEPVSLPSSTVIGIAVWIGLLIDGIPESLVIGVETASHDGARISLRLAFFIANFPVALSSSIIMRENGMSRILILCMWSLLFVMMGVGAFLGSFLSEPEDSGPNSAYFYGESVMEGIASGSMLVMVSNIMLPEAFRTGRSLSGIAVLCGFLSALLIELSDVL